MDLEDSLARWVTQQLSLSPQVLMEAQSKARQRGLSVLDILIQDGKIPAEQRQAIHAAALGQLESLRRKATLNKKEIQLHGYEGIERYQILEEIGQGGMGRVFRAQVKETGLPVVIKTLLKIDHSQSQVERFHREGMALARLSHPNIARVYDFRLSESQSGGKGQPYLVMEHIHGQSLDAFLEDYRDDQGLITDSEFLRAIFAPLAEALAHCHEHGIVHRDIKPQNILVECDDSGMKPRPVLVDFGLVKFDKKAVREALELSQQLTQSGQLMGSPAFAAPEQLLGDLESFGPAIDVWGLAATIYWTVSRRPPYDSHSLIELLAQCSQKDPEPLRTLCPRVPAWLDEYCSQCLRRDPLTRPSMSQGLEPVNSRSQYRSLKASFLLVLVILVLTLSTWAFLRDSTAPDLTLTLKTTRTKKSQIKLSGTVRDEHFRGIWVARKGMADRRRWKNYPSLGSNEFSVKLELREGNNEFLVWAEDEGGLRSRIEELSIERDSAPPELLRLSFERVTYQDHIKLRGELNEASTIQVASQSSLFQAGPFTVLVPVKLGLNELEIVVSDLCKNEFRRVIKIERHPVFHVDPQRPKNLETNRYKSLAKAIAAAPEKARINLRPGRYDSGFFLRKTLQIVGQGERSRIVLTSSRRPLQLCAPGIVIKNIRIENSGTQGACDAIQILDNDCVIEQCSFFSKTFHGVNIGRYKESRRSVEKQVGVTGTLIRQCEFNKCGSSALSAKLGAVVRAIDCTFRGNTTGVFVGQKASGRFEKCLFLSNKTGAKAGSNATLSLSNCVFKNNVFQGVNVDGQSHVTVRDSEFVGNGRGSGKDSYSNIRVSNKSELILTNSISRGSFGAGARAQDSGRAILRNVQLLDNEVAGVMAIRNGYVSLEKCVCRGNKKNKILQNRQGVVVEK